MEKAFVPHSTPSSSVVILGSEEKWHQSQAAVYIHKSHQILVNTECRTMIYLQEWPCPLAIMAIYTYVYNNCIYYIYTNYASNPRINHSQTVDSLLGFPRSKMTMYVYTYIYIYTYIIKLWTYITFSPVVHWLKEPQGASLGVRQTTRLPPWSRPSWATCRYHDTILHLF